MKLWTRATLGDLIGIEHGWPFKSELMTEQLSGRPIVVNIGNFDYSGGFRFESTRLREYKGDFPASYILAPGDLLLAMTCQTPGGEILGIPGHIPADGRTYLHNQRLGKVHIKTPDLVSPDYLYWLFRTADFNRYLCSTATGTKILHTSPSRIEAYRFLLPSLFEQHAIASILDALNDKIELNRRMNVTLEAMARATFQSWFVDFDPVRVKAEGRETGLPEEIAALFPDGFVESELGEIPKGWEIVQVSDIGRVVCGKTPSTREPQYYGTDIPFITIPDMHDRLFAVSTQKSLSFAGAKSQPTKLIPAGAICVSCIATPGLVTIATRPSQTNQQINTVVPNDLDQTYYWYWVLHDLGDDIKASGSGGSVLSNLSTGRFSQLKALAAPSLLRTCYHDNVAGSLSRVQSNYQESMVLTSLRDALLPKLVSGELHVPTAQDLVEQVLH